MKFEDKIQPVIRAYKEGLIDFEFAHESIVELSKQEDQEKFNRAYCIGFCAGCILLTVLTMVLI